MTRKFNILIVEDNERHLQGIKWLFEHYEWDAEGAVSAEEALEKLGVSSPDSTVKPTTLPDVITIDVGLPKMDGLQLLQRIKEYELTRSIPVVLITVLGSERHVKQIAQETGSRLVSKPFDDEDLVRAVKDSLPKSS